MVLLEGDEFVRGILEPAGLTLADVRNRNLISGKAPLQERPWTASCQLSRPRTASVRCANGYYHTISGIIVCFVTCFKQLLIRAPDIMWHSPCLCIFHATVSMPASSLL